MKRKIGVLILSMLLFVSGMLIVNNDVDVEATGGDAEEEKIYGLDFDYMWEVTDNLSRVIHDVYKGNEIRKGRDFGTNGDRWTANYTKDELEKLSPTLENVEKIQIKKDTGKPKWLWKYDKTVDVKDFKITINGNGYDRFPHTIPKNETYVIPTGIKNFVPCQTIIPKMNYNHSFINLKIIYKNLTKKLEYTADYYTVTSNNITEYNETIGNATYINDTDTLPPDQEYRVFLLEEEEGVNETLENISSNASGVILIKDTIQGWPCSADTSKCNVSVISRVYKSDSNILTIIDLLKNGTVMIADNLLNNGTFNFSYNYNYTNWSWCCSNKGFFYLTPHDEYDADYGILKGNWLGILRRNFNLTNILSGNICHGIIAYDIDVFGGSTHLMWPPVRAWAGWNYEEPYTAFKDNRFPLLHMILVNNSVGDELHDIYSQEDVSISGYIKQTYKNRVAYNVVGYINIDNSPNDNITVISNRYDSMWGECPGDSGAGAGIVLGIAKYFHDNEIKPKYNLKFLFTTAEERGCRGAWHFSHSHSEDDYNISRYIGTDQLGFKQSNSYLNPVLSGGLDAKKIMGAIANDTMYEKRANYSFKIKTTDFADNAEPYLDAYPFTDRSEECDIVVISKGAKNPDWYGHHRTGEKFQEGDSMKYIDRNDLNVTFEYTWNVVKYYCVNPDCWLENVTFESFDSTNDGDLLNDSIKANFTMYSTLPNDKVLVNSTLINDTSEQVVNYKVKNYTINSSGSSGTISVGIPDADFEHDYYLTIKLYNSTARINNIVFQGSVGSVGEGSKSCNDTSSSSTYHLYHAFGKNDKGDLCQNISNRITGSVFKVHEYGVADNITAYINKSNMSGPYKCMLYRANDSVLIRTTSEDWTDRDEENDTTGWAVFSFSNPKPVLRKDTKYVITCWGDNASSRLYYDTLTGSRGRYNQTDYQKNPPDPISFSSENGIYSLYCSYRVPPEIANVSASPGTVGYAESVNISADVTSNKSSIETVEVNIYRPEDDLLGSGTNYTMTNTAGDTYEYVFNDTWQNGQYNFTIWAEDNNGNTNTSSWYSFNLSAQATVSVCTVQDEYGNNTWVNITDPPSNPPQVGYELLNNGEVLRIWNRLDSYYFNTSSGIQITNHYDEYWSHNVLMLGYYNNDEWNLFYRTDELSGFNKDITSGETYVNATLWKDLSYEGYDFRLAIRYHLGADDNELTVIPYIKNLDDEDIPYNLGFAWEIKDIQIGMTPSGDYIEINGTSYLLNQSLDNTYKDLDSPCFYIREDHAGARSESLYLRWDNDLDYKVKVESRDGQYNAPVTLGIKIGTLDVGQEKYTSLFWHDASEIIYYFNSYDNNEAWATNPNYMVDGSTSNYASTTSDGDVELCDGNNCSGVNLGDILKVELRVYGYYVTNQYDIILRPVFWGTSDGLDYNHPTESSPGWSRWFDITYDPVKGMSEWSWDEVKDLDCDVEAEDKMFPPPFTLYAAKVEIRVTYSPNNDPAIGNPVPADGSTGVTIAPVLNITVSDNDGDSMNITWLSNSSGSWVAFGTNNSVGNGTYHQVFSNASVNGQWWYWKVNVTDGYTFVESIVYKFYTGYESKIKNTGSTNISGYLLMQVQYYDEEIEEWVVVTDCQNDTSPRGILAGDQFGLDTVFNGKINTSDLIGSHGNGTYRVYACFRDPDGDVLICDDETLMEDSYEFTVTES